VSEIEPCDFCGAAVERYRNWIVRVKRDEKCRANPYTGLHEIARWGSVEVRERWRVGRKVGRTIYRQLGSEPSDDDPLIGVMDTPELARTAVEAVNGARPREFSA
jgi:hypothetical protein